MLAQVPVILEALTGVRMSDLMERVPGLRTVEGTTGADGSSDGATPGSNGSNGKGEEKDADSAARPSTVQRVKVPAPDADEEPAVAPVVTDSAHPSNNSTTGPSTGATGGPRKQPVR
jgi:hypothetical protein